MLRLAFESRKRAWGLGTRVGVQGSMAQYPTKLLFHNSSFFLDFTREL